jgi:putative transposase
MFRISRIQQLMKPIGRGCFDKLVRQHEADKHVKRFKAWDQLTAMVYAQLSGARSLRELQAGFNAQRTHHYHLGTGAVHRSTLAEANAQRSPELFADVARSLMAQAQRTLRRECQELLYLLDSTSITLKGRGFDDWTAACRTRNTQGVKLHLVYEAHTQAPSWNAITYANVNDRDQGVLVPIEAGATYVFDKGYCDYNWWAEIDAAGARFVTRYKRNAALTVLREQPVAEGSVIVRDQIVRLTRRSTKDAKRSECSELRRIEVARPNDSTLVLATNDLSSPPEQIARLYKDRWQIELYFKWIKQHLNIGSFLGRSENAAKVQILTALITYLLLKLYRQAHGLSATTWHVLAELRATLFQRPSLETQAYHRRRQQLLTMVAAQSDLFA